MPGQEKAKIIEELHEKFSRVKGAVLSDFSGMNVKQMSILRKELRGQAIELRVVKNTLAKRAMAETPFKVLEDCFKGPMLVALSYQDVVAPAKILVDFAKKEPNIKLTAGYVEGKRVDTEGLKELANLPSREVLLSKMLSVAQGPTRNFVGTLNGVTVKLVGVLNAIQEKKTV